MSTEQRLAVITGASSGIGAALARALAERGWHCVLLARRLDRLQQLAAEIGGEAEACDVSSKDEVDAVAARVLSRHPAVDLLVNNAGIPSYGSFLGAGSERIEQVIRTNYLGSVWCLRAFLPGLERAASARVVNIASVAGTTVVPGSGPYSASKHAQLAFSRALRAELRPHGISVLSVNPGPVATEGFPQTRLTSRRSMAWSVLTPERIAKKIVRAIEHGRSEVVFPAWMRIAGISTALFPNSVTRVVAKRDPEREIPDRKAGE
ncbi:MAG: SDR family NAD(P)-dependent oxidoreductase [Gaiellaceae bacterium]|jgi:short-subunit dehydrogenase